MQKIFIRLLTLIVVMLVGVSLVHSEVSLKLYNREKNNAEMKVYVAGVGTGYLWANAELRERGQSLLYCQPDTAVLDDQKYLDILQLEIEKKSYTSDTHIEKILLFGLIKTFPCN